MPKFLPARLFRLVFLAVLVDSVTLADQRLLHPALVGEVNLGISFLVAHGSALYYTLFICQAQTFMVRPTPPDMSHEGTNHFPRTTPLSHIGRVAPIPEAADVLPSSFFKVKGHS